MLKLLCVTAHPDDEPALLAALCFSITSEASETSVICLTAGTAARNRGTALHRRRTRCSAPRRIRRFVQAAPREPRRSARLSRQQTRSRQLLPGDRQSCVTDTSTPASRCAHLRYGRRTHRPYRSRDGRCSPARRSSGQDVQIAFPSRSSRTCNRIARRSSITALRTSCCPIAQPIAPPTVTARIEIGKERFDRKDAAFRLRTTQSPLFDRVRKNLGERLATHEMYHLVATRDPREPKLETDLFEGVVED